MSPTTSPRRLACAALVAAALLLLRPTSPSAGPIWGGSVFMPRPLPIRRPAPAVTKEQCQAICYAKARPCTGRVECAAKVPGCYEDCDKAQPAEPPARPIKNRPRARVAAPADPVPQASREVWSASFLVEKQEK